MRNYIGSLPCMTTETVLKFSIFSRMARMGRTDRMSFMAAQMAAHSIVSWKISLPQLSSDHAKVLNPNLVSRAFLIIHPPQA